MQVTKQTQLWEKALDSLNPILPKHHVNRCVKNTLLGTSPLCVKDALNSLTKLLVVWFRL